MKSQLSLGAVILPLLALPTFVQAESLPGDAQEGHKLALESCSVCHRVEQEERGTSPVGAPAFQDIADDPAVTETALQVLETDNAIAYILGLR
jgi:mono/diheme cytochrome c family protein